MLPGAVSEEINGDRYSVNGSTQSLLVRIRRLSLFFIEQ